MPHVGHTKQQTPKSEDYSISCRNLVRYLGHDETRVQVLNHITLRVKAGKVYSIVGPSGCGKSTLLYLLGLLDKPNGGQIYIGNIDASGLDDDALTNLRNQYLGFVFQFHFLLPEFTALENVTLPMKRANKWTRDEMDDRAHKLLKAVGLGRKTHRRANHLSGGEQQRVAIARSLANKPRVVLADEPTGNLDSKNSRIVFDLMSRIAHEDNLSMVVVTHNPSIAEASDIILHMEDGKFVD